MTEFTDLTPVAEPEPEVAPEPEQSAPDPSPELAQPEEALYVVVGRDEVEAYASMGYQPGYVMLRP